MIINSGMRTDIPSFYSEWFMNRIREGKVLVRNPYFGEQVTEYELTPDKVDLLIFCTKDPAPMLKYIDELKDFNMFWFVTITPYGKDIEPYVRDKQAILDSFMELSSKLGIRKVSWRYDPILITDKYNLEKDVAHGLGRNISILLDIKDDFVESGYVDTIKLYFRGRR